jgi:hypothetical protein
MSPRKPKQITDAPELPTIKDYFGMMAKEQAEDIRRLKHEAAGKNPGDPKKPPAGKAVPHAWLLHPTRRTKVAQGKPGTKSSTRSAPQTASKKAAKKTVKKASTIARR